MKRLPRPLLVMILVCLPTTEGWQSVAAARDDEPVLGSTTDRSLDVRYVATPQLVVDWMLQLANVQASDLVYDLGCGDGRIVVTAAKEYGCTAIGVDIDPKRVEESQANVQAAGVEDLVTIHQQDIFDVDLSDADVVMLYLTPQLNVQLIPQLETMKPGSRIVSHDWDMAGVDPDAIINVASREHGKHEIYMWTTPLKKIPVVNHDPLATIKKSLAIVVVSALGLAGLFTLFRKRLGTIRIDFSIDRPSR